MADSQFRVYSAESLTELLKKLISSLGSRSRGRELVVHVRDLLKAVTLSRMPVELPQTLVQDLFVVLVDSSVHLRARILCAAVIRNLLSGPKLPLFRGSIARYPHELMPFLLPLLLAHGSRDAFEENVAQFVQWLATPDESLRSFILPGIARIAEQQHQLFDGTQIKTIESALCSYLTDPTVLQLATPDALSGARKFPLFITSEKAIVTDAQIHFVLAFSVLHSWLSHMYGERPHGEDIRVGSSGIKILSNSMITAITTAESDDSPFAEAVLLEAVSIANDICLYDSLTAPQLGSLVPFVIRGFNKSMKAGWLSSAAVCLRFCVQHNHAVGDITPYASAFLSATARSYSKPLAAFETLSLCLNHGNFFATKTRVFSTYFPLIFRHVANSPDNCSVDFGELLPLLVTSSTAVELFHCLLDLPLMAAAIDREQEGPAKSDDEFRALYNYVLRNESGVSINFWESDTTLQLLNKFSRVHTSSSRVASAAECVPALLTVFFDAFLSFVSNEETLHDVASALLQRFFQLFGLTSYRHAVRKVLIDKLQCCIRKQPSLLLRLKKTILGYIGDASSAIADDACGLAIRLIYMVGEHGTREGVFDVATISEFHQVLEPVMYERLSKDNLSRDAEPVAVRLLLTLIASMTKLAACWPDLLPRVRLCLTGKILKQRDILPPSVVQSASQRLQLLKFPSIAVSIFTTMTDDDAFVPRTQGDYDLMWLQDS